MTRFALLVLELGEPRRVKLWAYTKFWSAVTVAKLLQFSQNIHSLLLLEYERREQLDKAVWRITMKGIPTCKSTALLAKSPSRSLKTVLQRLYNYHERSLQWKIQCAFWDWTSRTLQKIQYPKLQKYLLAWPQRDAIAAISTTQNRDICSSSRATRGRSSPRLKCNEYTNIGAPSVTGSNSGHYERKASSRNTTKDGMTAVIGPFKSLGFRLPCVYKSMTTFPVTIGLMLLLSAVNWKRLITANHMQRFLVSHNPEKKLHTDKNAEFQNCDR